MSDPTVRIVVSAVGNDPAWQALAALAGCTAIRFEPQHGDEAAPLRDWDGSHWQGQPPRLDDHEVDLAAVEADALQRDLHRPPVQVRRLDTLFTADMAVTSSIAGLVLAEAGGRQRRIVAGAGGLLLHRRPWLLMARHGPAQPAAAAGGDRPGGYVEASDRLPAALQDAWRLCVPAASTAHRGLDAAVATLARAADADRVIRPGDEDWCWGLARPAHATQAFGIAFKPRGDAGLRVAWPRGTRVRLRVRVRRNDATRDIATPLVAVDACAVAGRFVWDGREGWIEATFAPLDAAGPVDLRFAWGSRALVARPFSDDSGLALDDIRLERTV